MPVYQGRDSCYARKAGTYVRRIERPGIDTIDEAVALAHMCLKDLRRGWTYEQGTCRKIRMTVKLFERRVKYILTLARKHGASKRELEVIKRLVNYVLKHRKLPKKVSGRDTRSIIKKMIVKVRKSR